MLLFYCTVYMYYFCYLNLYDYIYYIYCKNDIAILLSDIAKQ